MQLIKTFIIVCVFGLTVDLFAQDIPLSLSIEEATVREVIRKIEKNTSYRFFYNDDFVDLEHVVSINIKEGNIQDILNQLLENTRVTYTILNKNLVVITPANTSIMKLVVNGVVSDANSGEPLPGVNIRINGSVTGTISNLEGKYSIECFEGLELIFSFVGYQTRKIKIGEESTINVILEEDFTDLAEVVVVGYGTQKKINVTGSLASIRNKDFSDVPVAATANSLAGKLPGVFVINRSGEPGYDGASLNVRGFGSPLIIVDGIETGLERIDPEEIESIHVLKDAVASIYGARAGNGVILVATKRGQLSEKPNISFSSSFGWQGQTVYKKYVNAIDYMTLYNEYEGKEFYDSADFQPYLNGTKKSTDWYGATFRKYAPIWESDLSVRGGNDKVKYYFSYGYLDQKSILKSDDTRFRQNNLRSNIDASISKSLDVSFDLSGRVESREYPGLSIASLMEQVGFCSPLNTAVYPDPTYPSFGGQGAGANYISMKENSGYVNDSYRLFLSSLKFNYKFHFIPGLSAKAFVNFHTFYRMKKAWKDYFRYYAYDPESNTYSDIGGGNKEDMQLTEDVRRGDKIMSQISLRYENQIGDHQFSALLLSEKLDIKDNYIKSYRENYISNAIQQINAGGKEDQRNEGEGSHGARVGYVGRINYNFKEKYLGEITCRLDGTHKFYEKNIWGFFPGISLGWRLSEENFIQHLEFLQNLKIRLSYGQAGDDNLEAHQHLEAYEIGHNYVFDQTVYTGIVSAGLPNKEATWETMTIYNTGLDVSMWNNKLYGEFDVFYRTREGILADRDKSLPTTFGAKLPKENLNSQNNRGFDLRIGHDNRMVDLRYFIEANISYQRVKWDHYEEGQFADEDSKRRHQRSGQWDNRWFGFKALGLFDSTSLANSIVDHDPGSQEINKTIRPGDIQYLDYNGDSIIDDRDKVVIGKGNFPEIYFGLNMGMEYKGIDLRLVWQGATNFNVYFINEAQRPFMNNATPLDMQMDRWTPENPDPNARFPRTPTTSGNSNNYKTSSFWLHDGTYLRLKNVQLGYTLPTEFTSKVNIRKARVYFSGFNVFTFTRVYPYDPETPNNSRGKNYPLQRTFTFGFDIGF